MKIAFLTLTRHGIDLARLYRDARDYPATIFAPSGVVGPDEPDVVAWEGRLRTLAPAVWEEFDAIVAVMALGIVVRLFGPLASDKKKDPAVVVLDDAGRFAIAVIGGHGAGANELAEDLALVVGAQAVVTTASDGAGLPAVDQIGRDDGWIIERAENLTTVAAAVVRGHPVAVWQEAGSCDWWRGFGAWPAHFHRVDDAEALRSLDPAAVLFISDRAAPKVLPEGRSVVYRPPTLVAGIGCKRGTSRQAIEQWVVAVMTEQGLSPASLAAVATVMLKIDEPGLIDFARMRKLPLVAFPVEQIADHPGIQSPSERVRSKIGITAVAEPSALRAAGASRLLVAKQKGPGVTLALARRPSF